MDPSDRVEYINRFGALLEDGEQIATATVTLYPEAVALGFTILTSAEFGPSILNNDSILIWVEVAENMRADPAFVAGVRMPIEFGITTNSSPARRFQRTATITVVHL